MRFELGLEKPQPGRAVRSAGTIAFSYIAGGMIPLTPYLITPHALVALGYSVGATILALSIFGFVKGHYTGVSPLKSAFRTTLIGGLAAAAAFSIAKLFLRKGIVRCQRSWLHVGIHHPDFAFRHRRG